MFETPLLCFLLIYFIAFCVPFVMVFPTPSLTFRGLSHLFFMSHPNGESIISCGIFFACAFPCCVVLGPMLFVDGFQSWLISDNPFVVGGRL